MSDTTESDYIDQMLAARAKRIAELEAENQRLQEVNQRLREALEKIHTLATLGEVSRLSQIGLLCDEALQAADAEGGDS